MEDTNALLSEQQAEGTGPDGQTRSAVVSLLVDEGPLTASDIAERLGISAAGVRRHLDILTGAGDVETAAPGFGRRGRGRPAKWFQLTPSGRGKLRHAYDDLAGAALRKLRDIGGQPAVEDFARDRIDGIIEGVTPVAEGDDPVATVHQIADALTSAGYSASVRKAGSGVQICQHHCPVAHVATEFPELCEAETERFTELLGTHVQRLATIANGDCVCTTHVPLHPPPDSGRLLELAPPPGGQPASPHASKTNPSSSAPTLDRKATQ
ncbi:putative SufR family transcriptional regulator [Gordonia hirsuta DSM 44140 = NBRC 16056]|uniref:Putative SufR family transcriptional regulator n=1 Tax=Gordonia hirsuta DSM 44140 = NBRC 16056 TaxID=1121927 RepID=L7LB64_9ACTN|nr:metalloregulator ArsR/SmtB family transcription factor [Gordonia hirsuta]GAC57283.1 putative SufR family transcriptional regulator [Gordonia hirsuta DSM 44140 = NBRC 16056]